MTGARPDGALIVPAEMVIGFGDGALVDPECLWCEKGFRRARRAGNGNVSAPHSAAAFPHGYLGLGRGSVP
jgi:hypothetical protein